jgi:hypothetical protein
VHYEQQELAAQVAKVEAALERSQGVVEESANKPLQM